MLFNGCLWASLFFIFCSSCATNYALWQLTTLFLGGSLSLCFLFSVFYFTSYTHRKQKRNQRSKNHSAYITYLRLRVRVCSQWSEEKEVYVCIRRDASCRIQTWQTDRTGCFVSAPDIHVKIATPEFYGSKKGAPMRAHEIATSAETRHFSLCTRVVHVLCVCCLAQPALM